MNDLTDALTRDLNSDLAEAGTFRPEHCSEAEWALRLQLADCYHLVDHLGWTEMIFNHISVRLPGEDNHYLVNPFGLNYGEVTPANLLKVGLDGQLVAPSPHVANPAGFALHSAIHGARPDLHCIFHTHTTALSTVAMKQAGFSHDNFYGAQLFGRVGYHDFEGITLFDDEKDRMLNSLGDKHVLVLRNHGVAVCESTIPRAFFLLWTAQRAAEIQCSSAAHGGADVELTDEVRQRCSTLAEQLIRNDGFAIKFFDAILRKMKAARR